MQILALDRSQTASSLLVPVTTADNAEQRCCCECHEEEELRVEVVHHEGSSSQHRSRYEEVENEGVCVQAGYLVPPASGHRVTKSLKEC